MIEKLKTALIVSALYLKTHPKMAIFIGGVVVGFVLGFVL